MFWTIYVMPRWLGPIDVLLDCYKKVVSCDRGHVCGPVYSPSSAPLHIALKEDLDRVKAAQTDLERREA